ncbi:MAG: hypothetical protein H7Y15_18100 [Pseudonocardia sp.]|nr:hypothetical protein [Pseudonocardia sp.]
MLSTVPARTCGDHGVGRSPSVGDAGACPRVFEPVVDTSVRSDRLVRVHLGDLHIGGAIAVHR